MPKIKAIQTYLGSEEEAEVEGRNIILALERAVRENDHQHFLTPFFDPCNPTFNIAWRIKRCELGEAIVEFDGEDKKKEGKGEELTADDLNAMGKWKLKKLIKEKEIIIYPAEFKDVNELREAVAEALGIDLGKEENDEQGEEDEEEEGEQDFNRDFVGLSIWQPDSRNPVLARIYVQSGGIVHGLHRWSYCRLIQTDDSEYDKYYSLNCPAVGAQITASALKKPKSWLGNKLEFRRFPLSEDFNPTSIACEIINLAMEVRAKFMVAETG